MATELLPETQRRVDSPSPSNPERSATNESLGRWRKRALLFFILLVVMGIIGSALIVAATAPQENGPRLTHTIARGDLLVTVTEQGTLESSNNTEIKCKVRGFSTVTWVIPGGTLVEPGDELVRLDTKLIEEEFSLTKTNTHLATATLERTKADVAKAEIAIDAYKEGRFRSQLKTLEKELEIAERNLRTANKMLEHSETLFRQGYVTELEVEGNAFTVTQAELELKVKQTEKDVLERFTQQMELETLNGNLIATKSKLAADEAGLSMDTARRDRAEEELGHCVIVAERSGLVIYPSAAAWKRTPDVTEGATVRKDQVLLLMPDLTKMQIKVGIHESIVDRVKEGMPARVTLPDRTLEAEVSSVATVTRPAGWWTGNVVKYDTIIALPEESSLKPGMSAEVEVILARHDNVLTIPVAAVVETEDGAFCWVKTAAGVKRRALTLGDSNDVFIHVEAGVKEGDEVVLHPQTHVREAERNAANTYNQSSLSDFDLENIEVESEHAESGD